MVKHTQRICWLLLTNCFSVFDHFVGLSHKELREKINSFKISSWFLLLKWERKYYGICTWHMLWKRRYFQINIMPLQGKCDSCERIYQFQYSVSRWDLKVSIFTQTMGPRLKTSGWLPGPLSSLCFRSQIKWILGIPGDIVVKSKLSPGNGSAALRQFNPIHKRGHEVFFLIIFVLLCFSTVWMHFCDRQLQNKV